MPEPVITSEQATPDQKSELAERLSMALLHTLEQLNPVQRAAFLLHDVFGYSFREIGSMLEIDPATCRKTAQRARQYLKETQPASVPSSQTQQEKINAFLEALQSRDVDRIQKLLAKDAILYSDGGGKVTAARKPIYGSDRISRFLNGIVRQASSNTTIHPTLINGHSGFIAYMDGRLHSVWTFHISSSAINSVYIVLNPDKLKSLEADFC